MLACATSTPTDISHYRLALRDSMLSPIRAHDDPSRESSCSIILKYYMLDGDLQKVAGCRICLTPNGLPSQSDMVRHASSGMG